MGRRLSQISAASGKSPARRAKLGRAPLAWHFGSFTARLMDGREVGVHGLVSPPFGVFQGSSQGPNGNHLRTLVHLPSSRVIATLRSSGQCRALASELAPVLLQGELPDPGSVVERHVRESI